MHVLAINGSARADGNTALLIQTVFDELHKAGISTELVQLGGAPILPCRACWACGGKGNCVHGGDRFQEIFEKMKAADGILLASPAYAANISASMQALLERSGVVSDMNRDSVSFRFKVGGALSVARRAGAMTTLDALQRFFTCAGMVSVGASYWPVAYGQMPGDVTSDAEALATAQSLGQNMAHVLQALAQ